MPPEEMFVSAVRSSGDMAGVFEYVDETGSFYLYDKTRTGGQRVMAAIHILSGNPDFSESDVEVRCTQREEVVGLFIRDRLWAVFSGREAHGGKYRIGGRPEIPDLVASAFGKEP